VNQDIPVDLVVVAALVDIMKAVAWSLIFLVVIIGLSITAAVLISLGWFNPISESTSKYACKLKIQRYCLMLVCDRQPDVDLTGCTESGATPTKEWCEKNGYSCKTG
jgi:hypothetical protein